MLDSSGNPVVDSRLQMPLAQLIGKIQSVLAGSANQ